MTQKPEVNTVTVRVSFAGMLRNTQKPTMKSSNATLKCTLQFLKLNTPIGPVTVSGCEKGIHEVKLTATDKAPCGKLRSVTIDGEERKQDFTEPLKDCLGWLESFFKDADSVTTLPLPPLHTTGIKADTFVSKVLQTLAQDIPVGETISYGGLAAKVGNPKACRAVGMAMRINQVPLLVPCHRVVNSDGSLGNYMSGKGVAIKKFLLDHEGAQITI